jgi:hypothetical protein
MAPYFNMVHAEILAHLIGVLNYYIAIPVVTSISTGKIRN